MNIRLVTTSFNDEVHGTSNEKKTGCGINLLKSENVTRYHRGGIMTDLGEITCEKCKTRIAKDMIKSDQKEMKFLLKEEKIRAKKGIVDEGIVPLGNTTAKITREQAPAPAPRVAQKPAQKPAPLPPEEPAQINATIPGTGVAIDNSLAQFAINKPTAEPEPAKEDDFLAQFAVNKPQVEPEPAPEPVAQPAPQQTAQDDFLAQFAVPSPAQAEPKPAQAEPKPIQEAPAAPPVIDDISAAIAAMNTNIAPAPQPANEKPVQQAPAAEPQPAPAQTDDILSMFSIETPEKPASRLAGIYDNDASVIDVAEESLSAIAPEPVQQAAPVIDDISAAVEAAQANIPKYEAPVQPEPVKEAAKPEPVKEDEKPSQEIDNMSEWDLIANQLFGVKTEEAKPEPANEAPAKPAAPAEKKADETAESAAPAPVQEAAPVIDDISAAINAAAQAVPTPAPVQEAAPVIDDISAAINAAAQAVPTPAPVQEAAPVIDDISAAINTAAQKIPDEVTKTEQEADVPVFDDISAAVEAAQNAPKAAPVQQAAPIFNDIASAVPPTPQKAAEPAKPAPSMMSAAPVAQQAAAPAGMPAMGQVISVPQITGYDAAKQPIYTYVQMQITGYGENGQPVLSPVPGQEIPEFEMPFNKNTRLQEAIKAAQEVPTSAHEMTPGQRIAAAEAAKGSPISANVSKIATNAHSRSTSQAFINAISESKEYANQSLTDTQGLQQRSRVIGSIEDVLSQLGDNSIQQKKAADAQVQQNIPTFQEYKAPTRTASRTSSPSPASRPVSRPSPMDERYYTKAELKAMKKQEKIDAKFRKEMAKRSN